MTSNGLPKISIVTPSFNQAAFLEKTLLSVKAQKYVNLEHIIVDGQSTDGTVDILKRYSSLPGWEYLSWTSEPDRGQSDALNKGFTKTSGDIVGWLNSDDLYREGCFQKVIHAFEAHPKADVLYGDYAVVDHDGKTLQIRREIEFDRFILSYLHIVYVPTPSSFFKRRVFDDGNLIDLRFHYAMDYEFTLRLSQKGYTFQHIPELIADFRLHDRSKTGVFADRMLKEHDAIAIEYSSILQKLRGNGTRRTALSGLRLVARGMRTWEKLVKGYYFE